MPRQAMSAPAAFYSRYAPDKEAERFARAMLADKKPSLIFILGSGRNYLGKACRQLSPGARIVVVQPDGSFEAELIDMPDASWCPGGDESLADFLTSCLDDGKAAGGIALLEWQPLLSAYPREAEYMRSALSMALEHYSSAAATRSYWARRWLRNSVRFALKARRFARIRQGAGSLALACAGPSLEYALDTCQKAGLPIWALASAQEALEWRGFKPSLVLSSDPGHWAAFHLRAALAGACPLALPPSAALPAALLEGGASIVALDTGMAFEAMALNAAGAEPLSARSSGTAAGTALSLALAACDGTVYMLGQDLAARSLSAHARPYALDRIDFSTPARLAPESQQRSALIFERYGSRQGAWRLSRAFNAYAKDAFLSQADRKRCLRLSDSPVDNELTKVAPGGALPGISLPNAQAPQAATQSGPRFEEYAPPFGLRERADRMAASLEREGARLASLVQLSSLSGAGPLSTADASSLLAFAGKAAAPFIAEAARGRVESGSVHSASLGLKQGLAALLEFCNA
ncbi:MAG TPA: hypothetical protein DCG47_06795 [Spirochaetaceae bacterium]|nr:hypothetical protein [Spirochaetaceae bacterium]